MLLNMNQKEVEILTEYIEANQAKLYRIAYSYTKEKEAAMDVVQEAILKAYRKIHTLKDLTSIRPWIYRIVINEAINYTKRSKNQFCFNLEDYEFEVESKDEDFSEIIDVYTQVDKLKPKIKTVIILRFFEDMKLEEIAMVTNTNVNTVKTRLYTGLKELRIQIEGSTENEKIKTSKGSL